MLLIFEKLDIKYSKPENEYNVPTKIITLSLLFIPNDSANFNMCGVIDTTGHTTYTDVYARLKHDNGSSQNMLLWYGQLMVYRIG